MGLISTLYTSTLDWLVNSFTQGFMDKYYDLLCGKLGMIDLYALA